MSDTGQAKTKKQTTASGESSKAFIDFVLTELNQGFNLPNLLVIHTSGISILMATDKSLEQFTRYRTPKSFFLKLTKPRAREI
jgi:hypothetical protein